MKTTLKFIIIASKKTQVIDKKSSISRLSKPEKAELTDVSEHFSGESNAESGLLLQALIIAGLIFASIIAYSQTINIGSQQYIATCNSQFFDAGGANGFAGYDHKITTIGSSNGKCLAVLFTHFDLGFGADLKIYQGSDTESGILIGSYSGNSIPPLIEEQMLTFEYIPPFFFMGNIPGWEALVKCVDCTTDMIRTDPASDCDGAIPLCDNQTVIVSTNQYTDTGNDDDEDGTCIGGTGSGGSVWYTFSSQATGQLDFSIAPDGGTDYDFVLYDATNGCTDLDEISCNYSADFGQTGLTTSSSTYQDSYDDFINDGCCCSDYYSGNSSCGAWNEPVDVTIGHQYMLFINFYSGSNDGFTLHFQNDASTVSITDNIPPLFETVTQPGCNGSQIQVAFSENIDCSTLQASDFAITGYTVSIANSGCVNNMTNDVVLNITPALPAGNYTLSGNTMTDMCGNILNDTYTFTISNTPVSVTVNGSDFCQGNNTTLTTTTSGTGTLTYNWSTGGSGSSIAVSAGGTYCVTVSDACAQSANDCVTINALPAPTIATSVVCGGGGTTASLTMTGCTGTPAWFEWDYVCDSTCIGGMLFGNCIGYWLVTCDSNWVQISSTANASVSAPYASQYMAQCTSSNACVAQEVVDVNCSVSLSVSVNSATVCYGACINIAATVSGGTGPFTYTWSSVGLTGAGPHNLCPGITTTYTVTVTDAAAVTAIASGTITVGSEIIIASPTVVQPSCGSTNGSVSLSVSGGSGGYTYLWSPGGETTSSLSNLGSGSYFVTVTDNSNCTATSSANLSSVGGPSLSVTVTDVPCVANSGAATVTATGGTAPYIYLWTNSATTPTISNLAGGTYTVSVTDAADCVVSISAVVTDQTPVSASITNPQMIPCYGTSTGGATASVSGGTAPISFLWTSGESSATATALPAGINGVLVTDANGCQDTATVVITQADPVNVFAHGTNPTCGSSCNGTLTADVTGGLTPYTFAWSNGLGNTANVTGVCAGTYTVTVTDAGGCVAPPATVPSECFEIQSILVDACQTTEGYQEMVFFQVGTTSLNTSDLDVTWASSNIWQGVCTDPVFVANVNATITGGGQLIEPIGGVIPAGANVVLITSSGLLTQSFNSFVNLSGPLYVIFQCGSVNTGGHFANAGTGTRTLIMNFGAGCSDVVTYDRALLVDQSGATIAADGAYVNFSYSGNASYENYGCVAPFTIQADSVTLTGSGDITSSIVATNVSCNGASTGAANLTITGGTVPVIYNWSNSASTEDLTNIAAGTYYVTVSDANTCTTIDTITITEPEALNVSATETDLLCNGANTGAIELSVSGGTSPYSYSWSNGASSQNLSNIAANSYTVTVSDLNLCTQPFSVTITEPPALTAVITGTNNQCSGDTTGAVLLTVNGGTPSYTYVWSNGQSSQNQTGLIAGSYAVTITDLNNCTTTSGVTITQPAAISALINAYTNVSCYGLSDGSASVSAIGGTSPYIYSWSTTPPQTTVIATGLAAGAYSVTVSDANLCTASTNVTITEQMAMNATATATNVLCYGMNSGTVNLTVTGGNLPYTYIWSNGATTEDLSGLIAGTYDVTLSDANSCTVTASVSVTSPTQIILSTENVTNPSCNGGSDGQASVIASGGTPPYTYSWNTSPPWNQPSINNLPAGNSIANVFDANNCMSSVTIPLSDPSPIITNMSDDVTVCRGIPATLSVIASGGTPPYSYQWSNGITTSTNVVTPDTTSSYSCYITDSNNCNGSNEFITVSLYPSVTLDAVCPQNSICPGDSTQIYLTPGSGVPPYTLSLEDGSIISSPYYSHLTQSEWVSLTVRDQCDLTSSDSIYINVYPAPQLNVSADNYSGCNPLIVNFHETSPNTGQSYVWNFDDEDENNLSLSQNPVHVFNIPGSYNVSLQVTSAAGCKADTTFVDFIIVYPLPDARFTYTPTVPNIITPRVEFTNLSNFNITNYWSFGDGSSSLAENPDHLYSSIGTYIASLMVTTDKGCTATTSQLLIVQDYHTLYAPTAFSPDGDNINDMFYLYGSGILQGSFHLFIYNRWGEMIFESEDILKGWDGKLSGGEIVKAGTYAWLAVYKDFMGNQKTVSGKVTVVR
ncbi:MAG: hypothetical protein A2309_06895 [Bacteroidetes bacterium RIFOXYB2_FULL_35_7]|nr:MAG: hypothetical protein A2X01_03655 [Bacteroidetes bacterium GWF2_35_48]OFY97487.1 MAG: hypothetical protein A2309_06895 [Bacteroidetes bacterium RIFOXYB2_FULL_35_7]HBX51032.1 hypothetical protein [Bacteroidales bacterium]